jgi:hypothetical protein
MAAIEGALQADKYPVYGMLFAQWDEHGGTLARELSATDWPQLRSADARGSRWPPRSPFLSCVLRRSRQRGRSTGGQSRRDRERGRGALASEWRPEAKAAIARAASFHV